MGSRLEVDGRGIATFTIDEPATRNALSTKLLADIERTLTVLKRDRKVRVLVFTGAGEVFSSGADRSELGDPVAVQRTSHVLSSVLALIDESAVPVVCRINGAAFGAGLAIIAAADIGVAVEHAYFALPEVRFGLVAWPAAAACLGRIGQAAALDVFLTGREFTAVEAQRMNLITKVVRGEGLQRAVDVVVSDLLLGDDAAVAASRRMVRQLALPTLTERLRLVSASADGA